MIEKILAQPKQGVLTGLEILPNRQSTNNKSNSQTTELCRL